MNPLNPEQKDKVCGICKRVNPGGLQEIDGRVICQDCQKPKEAINDLKYELMTLKLDGAKIRRPSSKIIADMLHMKEQQARAYRRVWEAQHPEYYRLQEKKPGGKDAIRQAIRGEQIGATTTPELSQAMKEAGG